jgi:hypothetical protein
MATDICGKCNKPRKLATMVAPAAPTPAPAPTQTADVLEALRQQQSAPPVPDMRAAIVSARKK